MKRRTFLASAGLAAAGLGGCVGLVDSSGLDADDYDVGMTTDSFQPETVEVRVGDAVVWGNTSSHTHTVTAYEDAIPSAADYFASGGFDSEQAARDAYWSSLGGDVTTGETYEYTFEVAGEYDYFCVPHEDAKMLGKVVVRE